MGWIVAYVLLSLLIFGEGINRGYTQKKEWPDALLRAFCWPLLLALFIVVIPMLLIIEATHLIKHRVAGERP